MKKLVFLFLILVNTVAFASDFSAEEIVGTYKSADNKVEVNVVKILIAGPTLFDSAKFDYKVDLKFDAGECITMYGGDQEVIIEDLGFQYNGDWKPTEYLSVKYYGDNPGYDGYVWVSDVAFLATKVTNEDGSSNIDLSFDFDIYHTPDYSDGEDGGELEFEKCYENTKTSFDNLIKIK